MVEAATSAQDTIRECKPEEKLSVIGLIERCGLGSDNEPGYVAEMLGRANRTIIVCERSGNVVGAVVVEEDHHLHFGINYLVVDENHRNQKIAKKLMDEAERQIRENGGRKIQLVVKNNDPAIIGFYERLGYEKDLGIPVLMRKYF